MSGSEKRMLRSEVPEAMTWNLVDLFESRDAWLEALEVSAKEVEAIAAYKGKLCQTASTLYQCLGLYESAMIRFIQIGTYVSLKQSEDGIDTLNQEDSLKYRAHATNVSAALSFIESEITLLSEAAFEQLFMDEPQLEVYKLYLQDLYKKKAHKLSSETEAALAALGEVTEAPYRIYLTSKAADMTFESFADEAGQPVANSFAVFETKHEFSASAHVRGEAYQSFVKTLNQYKNTYAAVYATEVRKQVAMRKLRGFGSVTEMLLEPQKVSTAMYNNQIDIIFNEFAPHMRRFAALKQRVLGLPKMRYCDLKAPLDTTFNPPATIESIKETIVQATAVMGEAYQDIMKRAFDERWIDYSDNVGKSTGAFCASPYGTHPFILISYQDNMRSAFTLAHELGHAGHFALANAHQRVMDTRPSTYFVEAPSTMNEMLLGQYLLKQSDDPKMKRWVILQLLGTYYHNFVTHMIEAEFQRRVYHMAENDIPLTAKSLCSTMNNVIQEFWGDSVEIDEAAGMTWMRQPHYYMGLYPYTYSAGLTVSTAVAKQIEEEGQAAVDRWLEVLKAGGTKKPEDLIRMAGLDMTSPEPIRVVVDYVGDLITQLEALYEMA